MGNKQSGVKWAISISLLIVGLGSVGFAWHRIDNAHYQMAEVKKTNQKISELNAETDRIKNFGASDGRRAQVVQAYSQANTLAKDVVKQQSIISQQSLNGGTPPAKTQATKDAQKTLSKDVGEYRSKDDNTGSMEPDTVLSNWYEVKKGQKLSYNLSSISESTNPNVMFEVDGKDGKPVSYITAKYDSKQNKFIDFTYYTKQDGE